jgi:hypothetical protein
MRGLKWVKVKGWLYYKRGTNVKKVELLVSSTAGVTVNIYCLQQPNRTKWLNEQQPCFVFGSLVSV